ncbi:hypothetical protein [Nocardioides sp. WS12]|uniref:hypothetical protein n=1 Tax=Nocardioides sp. WS12 TaxID=2486272 RepID=UPI0015FA1E61|nr:hypothetical protein [Nocardioides sp. WS12]
MTDFESLPDGWMARMEQMIIDDDVASLSGPWIVLCIDMRNQFVTHSGPFPDGMSALLAADADRREQEKLDEPGHFAFDIARLAAPNAIGAVADSAPPGQEPLNR